MASSQGELGNPVPQEMTYGVIHKQISTDGPHIKPQPAKRRRKPKKQKSHDATGNKDEDSGPPVPCKNKALRNDIRKSYQVPERFELSEAVNNNNTKPEEILRPVIQKQNSSFPHGPTQVNPFYDGVILVNEPHRQQNSPIDNPGAKYINTNRQSVRPSGRHAQPNVFTFSGVQSRSSGLSQEVKVPSLDDSSPVPIYEMAGPIRSIVYEEVPVAEFKPKISQQPQYPAPPRAQHRQRPTTDEKPAPNSKPLTLPPTAQMRDIRNSQSKSVDSAADDKGRPVPKPRPRTPVNLSRHDTGPGRPPTSDRPPVPSKPKPRPRPKTPVTTSDRPASRHPLQRMPAFETNSVYDDPKPNPKPYIYEEAIPVKTSVYEDTQVRPVSLKGSPINSMIINRKYYDYMCEFRKIDLKPLFDACSIVTHPVIDNHSDDIEVRFENHQHGNTKQSQDQFMRLYHKLERQLWIEYIAVITISDIARYRNEVESRFKCLCFSGDQTLEIVCEQNELDALRAVTQQFQIRPATSQWPVGYDVAGVFNVYLYKADITKLHVDAITNSTNEHLKHNEGLSKAISEAAGPDLNRVCREVLKKKKNKKLEVSEVVTTTAGNMQCKAILHVVGPKWSRGSNEHKENECRCQMLQTHENVLETANREGFKSVAMPPISSETYGAPHPMLSTAITDAILNIAVKLNRPKLREIHIVDIRDDVLTLLLNTFNDGGRLKAPTGQYVAVVRLPRAEVRIATIDDAGYKRMIENSEFNRPRKQSFMNKLLCGGNRRNEH